MRGAASPVDCNALARIVKKRGKRRGTYHGGLVRSSNHSALSP
jgi:hypothetical protein